MIVRLPRNAAVDIWAVSADGRRLAGVVDGVLDVPEGAVLEVRGRRRARARLAWLTELNLPVVSIDVRRSAVAADELLAATGLPQLAVLTVAGEVVDATVLAAIARTPNLAVLQLEAPGLGSGELRPLREATGLRQIRLEVPHVPPDEVVGVLADRALQVFGLSSPRLSGPEFERVTTRWPLRELSVAIDYLDRSLLTGLRGLHELTQLALDASWLRLTTDDVTGLAIQLPHLRQLDLTENGRPVPTDLLLGALWLRPGIHVNGLVMSERATERFVERWSPDSSDPT